ncbi:MAG: PQQ-dependent sugar dehydrogenase [Candidatus Sumerlaeaceae bacterium]
MGSFLHSILLVLALVLTSTGRAGPPTGQSLPPSPHTALPPSTGFRVDTVTSGLEVPWNIVFAPDGRMFITERPGRLRIVENGVLNPRPVQGIVGSISEGEIGLMSIALHPDFAANRLLYLSHGYQTPDKSLFVRVSRYRELNGTLSDHQVILEGVPAKHLHAGCKLLFGVDRMLYVTTGEGGTSTSAQNRESLLGKVLRLDGDGKVPPDNPFLKQAGARPEIFSYGHRNGQGLALQPGTNLLFEAEHGPSDWDAPGGGDEVNVLRAGANYGWNTIHHRQTRDGMEAPVLEWTPATAPGGITFCDGSMFPEWKGDLFTACLTGECLIRTRLNGTSEAGEERLLDHQFGRLRDVAQGPDGALYIATSNADGAGDKRPDGDCILRLVRK